MTLQQRLQLNVLFFELIEKQTKIPYYDNRGWSPRKLYTRIEELETEIQQLTVAMAADTQLKQPRDSRGRFIRSI